jgi:hypothetical protein
MSCQLLWVWWICKYTFFSKQVNAGSDVFGEVWNVVFCRKKRMDVVDKTGTQTDTKRKKIQGVYHNLSRW